MKNPVRISLWIVCALTSMGICGYAADAGRPPVVLWHQFVGGDAVSALAVPPKALELLSSSNAVAFRKAAAGRFAGWLAGQAGKTDADASGKLAGLVEQLVSADAALEIRKGAQDWEVAVAVKTTAKTRAQLEAKFQAAAKALGRTITVESTGDWLVAGTASKGTVALAELKGAVAASGRPWAMEMGALIATEADLPRLSELFGWPEAPVRLGKVSLTISPNKENLKTVAKVTFPEAIAWPTTAWNAPTNLLRDPLVNFTAIRSLGPLLRPGSSMASVIGTELGKSQTYLWTVAQVPFQYYVAFASASPKAELDRLGEEVPRAWNPLLASAKAGTFGWNSNRTQIQMAGAPPLAPFIVATNAPNGGWITGGFFPFVPSREPAPKELLDEFQGREEIVYYDWEISQERVGFWRVLGQISPVFGRKAGTTETAELRRRYVTTERFLETLAANLGNTVTEATVSAPKELSVVRKSHLGLSGFELVRLARWLVDSPSSISSVAPPNGAQPPKPGNP